MPLPSSGQIGFNNLNDELLRNTTNQLSMSDAADNLGVSYNTAGSDQLGMDEFYGKSYTGYAYTMSVSPTSSTIVAAGETKTYTYSSDGAFGIVTYPAWATPSIASGSAGTNLTFNVVYSGQDLDAAIRYGTITLQSPLATSKYIYVTQSANPATLTIGGGVTYDYRGGSNLYYSIDTSPESQVTWNATLGTYTGFGHRIGSSGAFSATTLSGTGDTNIYISASANNSTSTDVTTTITVDPQNINDPNATATATVLKKPSATFQIDIGGGNYQNITSYNFAYSTYGLANAVTLRISTNQAASSATVTLTGSDSDKFSLSDQGVSGGYRFYKFYPNQFNSSNGTYTTTARMTFVDLNFDLTLTQTKAPAPTVSISPSSNNWTYTDTSNVMFTATVNNQGNTTLALNFNLNSAYFKLVDYSSTDANDGAIVVTNPNGNVWVGSSSNPSPYTYFRVYARPVGNNNSAGTYSTTLSVSVSTSTGTGTATADLTQTGAPAFTSADWTGVVSITSLGAVSATNGNSTTTVAVSPTSFAVVTSATSRTVSVSNVTAPSGYSNSGTTLGAFNVTVTQPAAPRTLTLSADASEVTGDDTSVTLTITDVYYNDTPWTLSTDTYGGYAQLGGVNFAPSSTGDGDETYYLTFSQNTSGVDRANRIYLTGGVSSVSVVVIQHSFTPAPSFGSIISPTSFAYDAYTSGYEKSALFTVSGTHSSVSFNIDSPYFELIDYSANAIEDGGITVSNVYGNIWTGTANYSGYSTYRVYVRPQQQNNSSANYTTNLTMRINYTQGSGGTITETRQLTQLWNPSLSASPSSLSFVASSPSSQTVSVTSNIAWTATVSGTGFEISGDNSTFGTSAVGKTGNDSVYVRPTTNSGGSRTGTLTITGNAPYTSTSTSVSLSQDAATGGNYYDVDIYGCDGGCVYLESSVGQISSGTVILNRWYMSDCGTVRITGVSSSENAVCTIDNSTFYTTCPACN